ncbi:MAG: hypothetical protein R3E32_06695 [Chitinophagales bacterium]
MDKYSITIISQDLSILVKLIEKYDIPGDYKALINLEATIDFINDNKIEVENIEFFIEKKISGTNPCTIENIAVFFQNICKFTPENLTHNKDVITEYSFQIDIDGYDEEANEYKSCWHLDKNIPSTPPKFTHPYYHFQFGGNTLETCNAGELIILGSPRLPHPPMDLFLGFHFIINNFFSSKDYTFVNELLNDDEYQSIIKRAQERMWTPYFNAFGSTGNLDYTLNNIFPLYIE